MASTLGCAQLLGLKEDLPSGPCKTDSDCAPGEVCALETCSPATASAGSSGAGSAGGSTGSGASTGTGASTGRGGDGSGGDGSSGDGSGGDGSSGDSGNAGSAGSSQTITCGGIPVDGAVPCAELPDGTPINFPGGSPQGPCALGTKVCQSGGSFSMCLDAIAPGETDCSTSEDKNCDGEPDDSQCGVCNVGSTQYCYDGLPETLGIGNCEQGTQVCQLDASGQGEVWGPCAGEVTPALYDTCDAGNDGTCNGVENEGCDCVNNETSDCGSALGKLGNCAAGTSECMNGSWGSCSVTGETYDSCEPNDDANCNGYVNEGCACVSGQTTDCGTSGTGCTLGTSTCSGGFWGSCLGNVCVDFAGNTPTSTCTVHGSPEDPVQIYCYGTGVCSTGYYVSYCETRIVSDTGSFSECYWEGYDDGGKTATYSATSDGFLTCGLAANSCTCRRIGF